jgi:hypothetical protein
MNAKVFDHLVKYEVLCAMAVALILGAFIGSSVRMQLHHCPVCPKCPELVARSHVERDSIIVHDTVRIVKYAPAIVITKTPDPDPAGDSIVAYKVIDTMPDQAIIGFSIASRELPDRRLPDLTHEAWYLAKPDRIRIINDTLTVQLPPLPCPPRWRRDITIGGICLGVGAGVTAIYLLR